MLKKLLTYGLRVVLGVTLPILMVSADNLMDVYQQALANDPTFKKAQADWLTAKQNLPIARSGSGSPGSGLFPFIDLSGGVGHSYQRIESGPLVSSGFFNANNYALTITQPIFNYATWKSITSAEFSVKSATATYLAAAQDLMARVATAYFNVLRAYDKLQFTLAQEKSFLHQLVTTQQKYQVGLVAITGVYDAQASYDGAIAQEIQDRNNLQDQLENLRAMTGATYTRIQGLKSIIPLVIPQPQSIDAWVAIAERQNYAIQSDLFALLSARETIKQTRAARYPTLTGSLSYGAQTSGEIPGLGANGANLTQTTTATGTAALNVNFPMYQGGYVFAATKQTEYKYLSASDQLDFTHRDTVRQTRESFLGVQSGISQINADHQAILSARNKLDATQAGYVVGTRTMNDVLDAVSQLYQTQQQWADDRYNYVLSIITLKQQAGTLSPRDLAAINTWLSVRVVVQPLPGRTTKPPLTLPPLKTHPQMHPQVTPASALPPPHVAALHKSLASPTAHYTIQLYATRTEALAEAFIYAQGDQKAFRIVTLMNAPDWYKVVYGNFATPKAARQALAQLPPVLQKDNPWVIDLSPLALREGQYPLVQKSK